MRTAQNRLVLTVRLIAPVIMMVGALRVAHADPGTARAKKLYDDGLTSYNLGHYEEALKAFDSAYRVVHDSVFLFNIAQCERQLHRYEDAERSYRAYLRESPNLSSDTNDQVQKLIAEMDHAIEEQRSRQPPTGTQAPSTNQPTERSAPPPRTTFQTQPVAPAVASQPQGTSSIDHRPTLRKIGIGLLITGVLVAGVGGGLAGYSASLYSQAKIATVLGDQRDLQNRSDVVNETAWPLLGLGSAAIAGGVVTLALSFRGNRTEARSMVRR